MEKESVYFLQKEVDRKETVSFTLFIQLKYATRNTKRFTSG